jgi:hypothetical protein
MSYREASSWRDLVGDDTSVVDRMDDDAPRFNGSLSIEMRAKEYDAERRLD